MKISQIRAEPALASLEKPALKITLTLDDGTSGSGTVAPGISPAGHESVALPHAPGKEGGPFPLPPEQIPSLVDTEIAPCLCGRSFETLDALDRYLIELDGTRERSRFGAQVLLGISLAFARAAAARSGVPLYSWLNPAGAEVYLPVPMVNVFSGGAVGERTLDFQNIAVVALGAESFAQAYQWAMAVQRAVAEEASSPLSVALDGGFLTRGRKHEHIFEMLLTAVEQCGLRPGEDVALAINAAANHFHGRRLYHLKNELQILDAGRLTDLYKRWITHYPLVAIADGCSEDDWQGWKILTEELGDTVWLIGGDLIATQPFRMRQAVKVAVGNAVSLNPAQVGTLSETLEVAAIARTAGYRRVAAARSMETPDVAIADLAIAAGTHAVNFGALQHPEHLAKYHRMIEIEKELGETAGFLGRAPFFARPPAGKLRRTRD